MSESARHQLNAYFSSEMDALRESGAEFGRDYPHIAQELALSEGRSRDPHVEHLIQSFAWMTSRLRMQMETEAGKLPGMLLQQLYPHLVAAKPSMAIVECDVDGYGANFSDGYTLPENKGMEPINLNADPEDAEKLRLCRFSTTYDTRLWPLKVEGVFKEPSNNHADIEQQFPKSQSLLRIEIGESDEGAAEGLNLDSPLRFFINLEEQYRFRLYDLLARHVVGVALLNQNGEVVKTLDRSAFNLCGFDDQERLFPYDPSQELGFTLLQDYFSFPEKFLFFETSGFEDWVFPSKGDSEKNKFHIMLILDESIPANIPLGKNTFKLNCCPVINLFEKTSEPIPVHTKEYRYRLLASRDNFDAYEVFKINRLFSVDRKGEQRELVPYFSPDRRDNLGNDYRWVSQLEESHRRNLSGNETWISLFNLQLDKDAPIGETIFAETLSCNRTMCESLPVGQQLEVIGSAPLKSVRLLTRPSRYRPGNQSSIRQWQLLSHLSLYHISLSQGETARDALRSTLELYVRSDDMIGQRQIESIEEVTASEDLAPSKLGGWRGYYRGTKYGLTLNERRFEGSPVLFGTVVHHFFALFCHINSFSALELKLGSRRVFSWKPMTGHKILA
jgi:type VI secretion system protein ImpG